MEKEETEIVQAVIGEWQNRDVSDVNVIMGREMQKYDVIVDVRMA